jgi:hypothetical protein
MILMLSGEGKTDMGQIVPTDKGMRFSPGPMAWIVDRLAAKRLYFSPLEAYESGNDTVRFVDETELGKSGKRSSTTFLPGIKYGKATAYYTRNAQTLGLRASILQQEQKEPVVAVLFRDTDKTNSADKDIWKIKVDSIKRGFDLVDFPHGVPMVPLPKSEAWLICALKNDPYKRCELLEDAPGNDDSPNSLKMRLEKLVGHNPTAEEQAEWVSTGKVDPGRIDMPSFNAFREDLNNVLTASMASLK